MLHQHASEAATAAILGIPALAHALIAEAGGVTPEWLGNITQISAFGLVAWIVFFMFSKWLPALQAGHAAQMAAQREAHTKAMDDMAAAHKEAIATLSATFSASIKEQRADLLALVERVKGQAKS